MPRRYRSMVWFLLIGLLLFCRVSPATAHQTTLIATLVPVVGSPSPVVLGEESRAKLTLSSRKGGEITFKLTGATDASGLKITQTGNKLRLDLVINGAPQTLSFPFKITRGKATVKKKKLKLVSPDLIEIGAVDLLDKDGARFGTLGARILSGP